MELVFPHNFNDKEIEPNNIRESFLNMLLEKDVSKRWEFNDDNIFDNYIKKHPMFDSINWDLVKKKEHPTMYIPKRNYKNFDKGLTVAEILGKDEFILRYQPQKSNSCFAKMLQFFTKKEIQNDVLNGPLTLEESIYKELDFYYTDYNFELPDQIEMKMPGKDSILLKGKF